MPQGALEKELGDLTQNAGQCVPNLGPKRLAAVPPRGERSVSRWRWTSKHPSPTGGPGGAGANAGGRASQLAAYSRYRELSLSWTTSRNHLSPSRPREIADYFLEVVELDKAGVAVGRGVQISTDGSASFTAQSIGERIERALQRAAPLRRLSIHTHLAKSAARGHPPVSVGRGAVTQHQ